MLRLSLPLIALVGIVSVGSGQPGLDRVTHRSNGKLITDAGTLTESPRGVEIMAPGRPTVKVAAADIIRIQYGTLTGLPNNELLAADGLDETGDPQATTAYAELLKKSKDAPERTRAALTLKAALSELRAADAKTGDEFEAAVKPALERLLDAAQLAKASWQTWPAHREAARIQAELNDSSAAAKTLETLAALPGLSPEQVCEARLIAAVYYLHAKQPDAAKETLNSVKNPPTKEFTEQLTILQAATTSPDALQTALDAATTPAAKGVGYALLGDALQAANKPREAMWAYLWTETVYTDQREARILALNRLLNYFEKQGDRDRTEQFRAKLPRARATD